jgi:hypothetical protein
MRKIQFLSILGWVFVFALTVSAGPPKGALNGLVVNSKGIPVKSARVFWQTAEGTAPHALRSNAEGRFRVFPIRDGYYDLRADSGGAWSEWEHNVMVRNGAEVNVTLHLVRTTPPSASSPKPGNAAQ